MQANDPYRALRTIMAPRMGYPAYQPGDGVSQSAVDNWALVVGEDVVPVRTDVIARPEGDAPREAWEAFAIGQGMTPDEAREASLKDLRKVPAPDPEVPGEPLPVPGAVLERPADDAVKADWVAYAVAVGADLMAYEAPGQTTPGDPVAVTADDQAKTL